jgi:hypothetical protein
VVSWLRVNWKASCIPNPDGDLHHTADELVNPVASKAVLPSRAAGEHVGTRVKSPNMDTLTDPDAGKKGMEESVRHSELSIALQAPIFEESKVTF